MQASAVAEVSQLLEWLTIAFANQEKVSVEPLHLALFVNVYSNNHRLPKAYDPHVSFSNLGPKSEFVVSRREKTKTS